MGPWIETDLDLDAAETIVRVNGAEKIRFPTNSMIFRIPHYLARMSKYMTLHPGDVVWLGTEGKTENLKHGDTVEGEVTDIVVLGDRKSSGEGKGVSGSEDCGGCRSKK